MRWNMPLVSNGQTVLAGVDADNDNHPLYAVGRTAHINLNTLASFGPSFVAREASLAAEVAWNRVLNVTKNREALARLPVHWRHFAKRRVFASVAADADRRGDGTEVRRAIAALQDEFPQIA